ncbi:MAG: M56 family metallopeptidase [Bacteroidota bacterium]
MEEVFVYLLKSSGLIVTFYLAYHILVRKETFFNSNRWFLLGGLFTSLLLPLLFIRKIILVEKPKLSVEDLVAYPQQSTQTIQDVPVVEAFDWMQFFWVSYLIVACVLVLKIILNSISLYRMLSKQQAIKQGQFKLINLNKNIAPFSFFNFIVYNSELYSEEELQNILLHEKTHSRGKHSIDVLIAQLMCALFWFNPFIWLYKKAITQNLEYIADQNAIGQTEDKKSYQYALLKVVSNQNCLPIANNFYQSLIKKRIVMLNKNQSKRSSFLKYALIVPVLISFVCLFQVKVIAQDKFIAQNSDMAANAKLVEHPSGIPEEGDTYPAPPEGKYVFDKISSDSELKNDAATIEETYKISFSISNVKRNSDGQIIAIKMTFDDKKGNTGKVEQNRTIPIRPIFFKVSQSADGKNIIGFYDNSDMVAKPANPINENKITTIESIKNDALIYVDGVRYDKENLNELDPKGLEKIEILKDPASLAHYGAKEKGEVIVITTNWTTKQDPLQPKASSITTLENGDEVVVFDRFNMKVRGYPAVQFTDNSPVLIFNGVQQKNPRLVLESMNLSKIKTIKVLNDKDAEVEGTPIHKLIITTK